jgi:hypothetical protein
MEGCYVGAICFDRAKINGVFSLRGSHVDGKDGPALSAEQLTVTADMFCDRRFRADGEVNLSGASIGGRLSFLDAHLNAKNPYSVALRASSLTVTMDMLCSGGAQVDWEIDRLHADGRIDLLNATIGGQLVLSGAHLNGKNQLALLAPGIRHRDPPIRYPDKPQNRSAAGRRPGKLQHHDGGGRYPGNDYSKLCGGLRLIGSHPNRPGRYRASTRPVNAQNGSAVGQGRLYRDFSFRCYISPLATRTGCYTWPDSSISRPSRQLECCRRPRPDTCPTCSWRSDNKDRTWGQRDR